MEFTVIDTFTKDRIEELHELYLEFPGWDHRRMDDVQRAVKHADLVIGLVDAATDSLVASGRVLSDFTYYAKIYDVIVAKEYTRQGIGGRLVDEIVSRQELSDTSVIQLCCRDGLVPFYRKTGFEPVESVLTPDGESERFRILQREPDASSP